MTDINYDTDRAEILAGLEKLKRNTGHSLAGLHGPRGTSRGRVRQQLYLTTFEHAALKTIGYVVSLAVGRPVTLSLIIRLALSHLLVVCKRSLADPVVAERLKADLLRVREERAAEHE